MKRNTGHLRAGIRHRVGADAFAESQVCCGRVTRRAFLIAAGASFSLAGAGALMAPLAAHAQQPPKIPRIGFLATSVNPARIEAFRHGLRELGYVEGKNIVIEARDAEGKLDRLQRGII